MTCATIHRWGRRDETDWDFWEPASRFIQYRAASCGGGVRARRRGTHGRVPERVSALKEAIVAADGLLLATPEYNNSIPGVFKNAIDWLSRPPADIGRVFGGKPVAVLGASPGGFGAVLSQNAWLPVLRTLGTTPWCGGRLLVSRAGSVFDEAGRLASDATKEQLRQFIEGFVAFVRRVRGLENWRAPLNQ